MERPGRQKEDISHALLNMVPQKQMGLAVAVAAWKSGSFPAVAGPRAGTAPSLKHWKGFPEDREEGAGRKVSGWLTVLEQP